MDLDPVGADLDLAAHLRDDLVLVLEHLAPADRAMIGNEAARGAAHRRHQRVGAARDAWTLHDSGFDRIAHVDRALEHRVGVEDAGDARAQDLARVVRGDQRGQRIAAMVEDFRVRLRVVEGEVAVGIDEARHHRHAAGVDSGDASPVRTRAAWPLRRSRRSVVFHEHVTRPRGRARAVDDRAVLEQVAGRHRILDVPGSNAAHRRRREDMRRESNGVRGPVDCPTSVADYRCDTTLVSKLFTPAFPCA